MESMEYETVTIFREGEQWTRVGLVFAAERFLARFLGGLFVFRKLPSGEGINGLLCYPCKFVYMFGKGFAIDIVYCNRDQEVIYIMECLVPHKTGPYLENSCFILVFPAETVFHSGLKVGERLKW